MWVKEEDLAGEKKKKNGPQSKHALQRCPLPSFPLSFVSFHRRRLRPLQRRSESSPSLHRLLPLALGIETAQGCASTEKRACDDALRRGPLVGGLRNYDASGQWCLNRGQVSFQSCGRACSIMSPWLRPCELAVVRFSNGTLATISGSSCPCRCPALGSCKVGFTLSGGCSVRRRELRETARPGSSGASDGPDGRRSVISIGRKRPLLITACAPKKPGVKRPVAESNKWPCERVVCDARERPATNASTRMGGCGTFGRPALYEDRVGGG
ncbi:hypothetical protein MRX96_003776 [Rhipicephalus microplus]